MEVDVKLHGPIRSRSGRDPESAFHLRMPNGVRARDLLHVLAERCGDPLRRAVDELDSADARFPRHIRMFANGEMLATLDQPLAHGPGPATGVTVVVMTPMMGG